MKTENKLKLRLGLSLLLLLLFLAGSYFSFRQIQKGQEIDETPSVLRNAFLLNEKVWRFLSSNDRLSVEKNAPPITKKPRVNGMLGLRSEINFENYSVKIIAKDSFDVLPLSAFYAVPKIGYTTDFRCIEGWSEETQYAGARFSDFLKFHGLGKKKDGSYYAYVGFETPDGEYYVSLDMESMLHEQTVLTYEMNGQPLAPENGAPIRLIIPIKYGIKSLKRIGKIIFSDQRPPDYWAQRGYDWYSGL